MPPDGRDLNYAKFVEQGEQRISAHGEDYNSHNTHRLDVEGMKALLLKLDFMQRIVRGEAAVPRGLSGMRIVITGADGFIGRNLRVRLRELGHADVHGVDSRRRLPRICRRRCAAPTSCFTSPA